MVNDTTNTLKQVGIGTTSPIMKLHVSNNTSDVLLLENSQPLVNGVENALYFKTGNGSFPYTGAIKTIGQGPITARLGFFTFTALSPSGLQENLTISDNGNVGVGNNNPSFKLDVNGGARIAGRISKVTDPINAQDAATKAYVDATTSSPTYAIGLSAEQGGYIFSVSADGKHGLVAETVDQSSNTNWYEAQDPISNPINHSADGDDFRDWRMPTKYELSEMFLQRVAIGGFSSSGYWSSTEFNGSLAWNFFFSNGDSNLDSKISTLSVRAIRAF